MIRQPTRMKPMMRLWVMRHRHELEQRVGHDVGPADSAVDYAAHVSPWRGIVPGISDFVGKLTTWPQRRGRDPKPPPASD